MNFYLAAVDYTLKHPSDQPTWKPRPAICTLPTAPFVPPEVRLKCWARAIWSVPRAHHRNDAWTAPPISL